MIINLYKINPDNSYGGMEESYSDEDVDITQYTPPKGYTFKAPANEAYVWNGDDWEEPYVPTLDELKSVKRAEIAASRFNAEVAGIMGIRTDRESQALLTGACLQAVIDPEYSLNWKTADGTWIKLSAEDIKAVGTTVRVYVQSKFDEEERLCGLIDIATTAEELSLISW